MCPFARSVLKNKEKLWSDMAEVRQKGGDLRLVDQVLGGSSGGFKYLLATKNEYGRM
jgi:hypothetical protein